MSPRTASLLLIAIALVLGSAFCEATAAEVAVQRDLVYARPGPDVALELDAYLPEGVAEPVPAVVVIHGGSWRGGNRRQLAVQAWAIARAGFAAFAIDYRLAPKHTWPAQIHDCKQAVRWVREHAERFGVDPARIGAYGYSAGGHLATLLALTGEDDALEGPVGKGAAAASVQAVVAGGAPTEFRDVFPSARTFAYWLGGTRSELPGVYEAASPRAYVAADAPPILFYHGRNDLLVPLAGVERTVELLRAEGNVAELLVLGVVGHMTAPVHPRGIRRSIEFLREQLEGTPEPEQAD